MCGICGWVGGHFDKRVIKRMMEVLIHRGPDDEGIYVSSHKGNGTRYRVVLGHRRLSIIDLATGSQPIHNEDKTVWIVFNGEVYDFLELREELEKKGHRFYTRSDTEVIVHLYEDLEEECVQRLNGMLAFALWDMNKERLLLVRDRLGIKPLHYVECEAGLVFASEIKALLRHPAVRGEIDLVSMCKYLTFEYVPAPDTIFKGIKKLPPGHILIWDRGRTSIKKYWRLSFKKSGCGAHKEEDFYVERLRELLKASIKRRLISDVPLGAFLSGGIDSSSIVSFMTELSSQRVKTFCIGFDDPSFNEANYAAKVARHFSTDHHVDVLSPKKLLDFIPKVAEILDEPLGDASIVPTYLLSKFTRNHVKVSISGDGGDELFAGYPTYIAHKVAGLYERTPVIIKKGIEWLVHRLPVSTSNISLDFKAKRFISGIGWPPEVRNFIWLGSFAPYEIKKILSQEAILETEGVDLFKDVKKHVLDCDAGNLLEGMLCLDMRFYLQDDILVKIDRASMANSLEARVPFLDHTLVEFVAGIPTDLKLKGFSTKYILKKAMSGRLPPGIANRPKKGFGIPIAKWIKGELKELVFDTFNEARVKREGFFNLNYVRTLLQDHLEGRRDNRKYIWTLLVFEMWYERYIGT